MNQKLIVISMDGLVGEDIAAMGQMPNFRRYLARGAHAKRIRSIYPTITYPCHTTMCTGVYPDKHGVLGNLEFCPGELRLPWKWFRHSNRWEDDLFFAAKRAGLTTAAVFWPVTGEHPAIDHLIAEYWPQSPSQSLEEAFREAGSSPAVLEIIRNNMAGVEIRKHPSTDDFIVRCAGDIIRAYQPDLLMLHPGNVDGYRHSSGVFNDRSFRGVEETDHYLGEIMQAVEEAGLSGCTNLVLTSDHGLIDVKRVIHLNLLLVRAGLIRIGADGRVTDWDAWCLAGGTSALIYLRQGVSQGIWQKTHALLESLREEGVYGISQVFTQEEIRVREHLGGNFSFVVETDVYTAFGDRWIPPLVTGNESSDYRYGRATHGHLPDIGPQPVFWAAGPGFREGAVIAEARLVDTAPTCAKILGLSLKDPDGQPLEALLRP